jgi:hypothetical protein
MVPATAELVKVIQLDPHISSSSLISFLIISCHLTLDPSSHICPPSVTLKASFWLSVIKQLLSIKTQTQTQTQSPRTIPRLALTNSDSHSVLLSIYAMPVYLNLLTLDQISATSITALKLDSAFATCSTNSISFSNSLSISLILLVLNQFSLLSRSISSHSSRT